MERIQDLREKIYLLTYGKPRYKAEISKLLYGKDVKQIYPEIKKLESPSMKWLKKVNYKGDIEDGRSKNRIYYQANVEPLFDSICKDLKDIQGKLSKSKKKDNKFNLELTINEKERLYNLLDHEVFRKFVYNISKRVEQVPGLNADVFNFSIVKNEFSHYCVFLFVFELLRVQQNSKSENNLDEKLEQHFKRFKTKDNFTNLSEGVLSLGPFALDKLHYLDYYTTGVLMSYLLKMYEIFPEISCSYLNENPLSKLPIVNDFLDFVDV